MRVWRNEPNTKHAWAFIYYCRKQGDIVKAYPGCRCVRKFCGHGMVIIQSRVTATNTTTIPASAPRIKNPGEKS